MKFCCRVACIVILSSLVATIGMAEWEKIVIDGLTGDAGRFACLKLDSYDLPHIAYGVEDPDSLKYAWLQGENWIYEVPEDSSGMGLYIDMELDRLDRANIAHFDPVDSRLMFTSRPTSNLETEERDNNGYTGLYAAIALDSDEDPNIVYFRGDEYGIKVTRRHNGAWTTYNVGVGFGVTTLDIAVDSSDTMHLTYNSEDNETLMHAMGDGVDWTFTALDTNVIVTESDIALDSNEMPHIMYMDSATTNLKYAYHDGSQWNSETAEVNGSAYLNCISFMLDDNDAPHVCYFSNEGTLVYLNKASGSWESEIIDDDGNVGHYCSMDIDSSGNVHVAYVDRDSHDLKYARQLPPPPTPTPTAPPKVLTTSLQMFDTYLTADEEFLLEREYVNGTGASVQVDEYIILDIAGLYWYAPTWSDTVGFSQWTVPVGTSADVVMGFTWPEVAGEFSGIRFWGAFLHANTVDLIDYDMIEWGYGENPPAFTFTTTAFENGQPIPEKFTCDGIDVCPELVWNQPEQAIQSYAIIMDDPDAPGGDWVHWVIYNIPSISRGFPEGVSEAPEFADGTRQGSNSWSTIGYRGPCPPAGGAHRYYFKLYALDTLLALASGATKAELLDAMEGHILYQTELMGTYQR